MYDIIGRILKEEINRFIYEDNEQDSFNGNDEPKVSDSEAKNISGEVNLDITNLRGLMRDPDCPVPGNSQASKQSYARKMMKGDRPMTKSFADFLQAKRDTGKLAAK